MPDPIIQSDFYGRWEWYDPEKKCWRRIGTVGGRGKKSQIKKKLRQRAERTAQGLNMTEYMRKSVLPRFNAIEWEE